MSVWRYRAMPLAGGGVRTGELSGESPAEVRAALRRIGLQPLDLRPVRTSPVPAARGLPLISAFAPARDAHLRRRRLHRRAEIADALATLLETGVPLAEAVGTLAGDAERARRSTAADRTLLVLLRERIRAGAPLAEAMAEHPSWFDPAEVAMARAGETSGELPRVLRSIAERAGRSGELGAKLLGALAYPAVVLAVGLGVVVFLSTKTLPDLTGILVDAGVEVPRLTAAVMVAGRSIVRFGLPALALVALLAGATPPLLALLRRGRRRPPAWASRLIPSVLRRAALADALSGLAELVRTGVPLTDALRVLAPTVGSPGAARLRELLADAAARVERGESVSSALDDPAWFTGELARLIAVGEASGELPDVLERVGDRYRRSARRLIDRLASLLEPAVILLLACFVFVVVMAAILPLIRLQEVL